MAKQTMRAASRLDFTIRGERATVDEVQLGALLRIADATEKFGTVVAALEREQGQNKILRRQLAAAKGRETKLRREIVDLTSLAKRT